MRRNIERRIRILLNLLFYMEFSRVIRNNGLSVKIENRNFVSLPEEY